MRKLADLGSRLATPVRATPTEMIQYFGEDQVGRHVAGRAECCAVRQRRGCDGHRVD